MFQVRWLDEYVEDERTGAVDFNALRLRFEFRLNSVQRCTSREHRGRRSDFRAEQKLWTRTEATFAYCSIDLMCTGVGVRACVERVSLSACA